MAGLNRGTDVLRLAMPHVRVEREGRLDRRAERVALLAHFATGPVVSRSTRELLASLRAAGFEVVVVSAAECAGPLDWAGDDLGSTRVLRKPNVGYDFGTWAVGLAAEPWLAHAPRLLLVNDSLVGPFTDASRVWEDFAASSGDVWGVTETLQFARHLQSYAVGYRDGVAAEAPIARFWRSVRHLPSKDEVIHRNEIGLGRLLWDEGFSVDAMFPAGTVVPPGDNPTIIGWRTLLDRGLPFVKREVVRSPEVAPGGAEVPDELRRRFGIEVEQWS